MRLMGPGEFRASITYILPEEWRHLIERKKLKLRTGTIEFNSNGTGAANREVPKKPRRRPEPLGGKARFLNELKDGRKHKKGDRLFKEKDVELAVEWFERQVMKDALRINRKDYYVRVENLIELVERAFEDARGHGDHAGHLSLDRFLQDE